MTAASCGGILSIQTRSTAPCKKGSEKPMWLGRGFDSDGDGDNDFFVGTRIDRGTQELISKILSPIFVLVLLWVMGVMAYKGVGYLLGWDKLTVTAAEQMAKAQVETLVCDQVDTLDPTVAKALSKFKGRILCLEQLTELDVETAKALADFKGESLNLAGLTTLSDEAARTLAQREGGLSLAGLTTLSDEAAKALAQHKGWLNLEGLVTLSDKAVKVMRANPQISLPEKFKR